MYARLSALFPFQDSHHIISNVQQGGYLLIKQVDPSRDAGVYTCIVRSRTGEEARRDMQLSVNSKLTIYTYENFLFSPILFYRSTRHRTVQVSEESAGGWQGANIVCRFIW